jgi:hypothetical protein
VPAWSNNLLARSIKRPKVHIADTGILAYLVGADARRIETGLDLGGMFYETVVAIELHRQISWLGDRPRLFHFRDRDQREVDSSSNTATDLSPPWRSSQRRPSTSATSAA